MKPRRLLLLSVFLSALLFPGMSMSARPFWGAEEDSLRFGALGKKLDEYCAAIQTENTDVQQRECDFLIESCTDSLVRQYVAVNLYERFLQSPLMGSESVAIHIFDKWFDTGKVCFKDDVEMMNARIFADFNRLSLIGAKAPELSLRDRAGESVNLFDSPGKCFQVLFFYDVSCPKCKVETILLRSLFENEDYPVDFTAVYAGDEREKWVSYLDERFQVEPLSASVRHLWDPDGDSDMQHKYGLLKTPGLFLIAPDNTIIGRSLDARTLALMLHGIFEHKDLEYGSSESMQAMDRLLGGSASSQASPSAGRVAELADHISSATLPKGDTTMFRQMTGDLLCYLATRSSEGCREGMNYLINNHILSKPRIWRSEDDSLKIIGLAELMKDLLSRSAPGTKIADIALPGELLSWKGSRTGKWRTGHLSGKRNIIIFYTEGCSVCDAQKAAARAILAQSSSTDRMLRKEARRTRVLLLNMDEILSSCAECASNLFDSFDLSTLPYITITDSEGIVMRRYVSLTDE